MFFGEQDHTSYLSILGHHHTIKTCEKGTKKCNMSYEQDSISVKITHIPKQQDPCEKETTHNPLKDISNFDRRPQEKDIMEPAKALLLAATRQMGTIFSDLMCLKCLHK